MLSNILKLIFIILLTLLTGCAVNEDAEADERFEIFLENDGVSIGMVLPNDDLIVLHNASNLTFVNGNGDIIRQISVPNQIIGNVITDGDRIVVAGRVHDTNNQEIVLNSFDLGGANQWENQLLFDSGAVESTGLNFVDNSLVLVTVSTENELSAFSKRIEVTVFNDEGIESEKNHFELSADFDFNISNIFIKNKDDILLQGVRTTSMGNDEGIPIFRIQQGNFTWFTETGHPGFQTVTNIKESPSGDFLFTGSKQTVAWAFMLDESGNPLWEFNVGDNDSKNWFYDALFINNEIKFIGYSNSGPDLLEHGMLFTTDLNGNIRNEVRFSGQQNKRLNSVVKRNSNELVLAGLRLNPGNQFEAWLFNTNLDGDK